MRTVEKLTINDIDAIIAIEQDAFAAPWTTSMIAQEFTLSHSTVWGIKEDGRLLGFAIIWMYLDEAHIIDFAVVSSVRRSGLGSELLQAIIDHCKAHKVVSSFLEVRVSNTAAINLYKKFGYETVAIRKHYYADNGEDAYVMQVSLAPTTMQ